MRTIRSGEGAVVAQVDALGRIILGQEPGPPVGLIRGNRELYGDEAGAQRLATLDASGWVNDEERERVGNIDAAGLVRDRDGLVVGKVEEPVDGAVLLMILAGRFTASGGSPRAPQAAATLMDEAQEIGEQTSYPGVRRNYAPLTDDELFGFPRRKN
ncbi:MAG: hypothetical protein GIW99_06245 [Candidatus Eremiobacteraeota bacterium]|nr:hypothetical protein [Candidatus Eremiobacteraeota bacterium]MBC5827268.1 hypothetical protein [Candidatus Eremiobacteraeota bacterium]